MNLNDYKVYINVFVRNNFQSGVYPHTQTYFRQKLILMSNLDYRLGQLKIEKVLQG